VIKFFFTTKLKKNASIKKLKMTGLFFKVFFFLAIVFILYNVIGVWCWYRLVHCLLYSFKSPLDCNILIGCQSNIPFYRKIIDEYDNDDTNIVNMMECKEGIYIPPQSSLPTSVIDVNRPNIVLIVLDDLDELITPYRKVMKFTDSEIFQKGIKYVNAYTPSSICCPARVNILTGRYPHTSGVLTNSGKYGGFHAFMNPFHLNGSRQKIDGKCVVGEYMTFPYQLHQHGYYTSMIGKYMNDLEDENGRLRHLPKGWDYFFTPVDKKSYVGFNYKTAKYVRPHRIQTIQYSFNPKDHITTVLQDEIEEIILKRNRTKPLFLYISPTAPHFPIYPKDEYIHLLPEYRKMFDDILKQHHPNIYGGSVLNKSNWLQNSLPIRRFFRKHKWHSIDFAKRMVSLHSIDDLIRNIHHTLDSQNELANTVWIFTSDNGYNYGINHLIHKMSPYESSIKIPFYIYDPRHPDLQYVTTPVSLVDISSTILTLANILPEKRVNDGQSLFEKNTHYNTITNPQITQRHLLFQYGGYSLTEMLGKKLSYLYTLINPSYLAFLPHPFLIDVPPFKAIRNNESQIFIEYHTRNEIDTERDILEYVRKPSIFTTRWRKEYEFYDLKKDINQTENQRLSFPVFMKWKEALDEYIH
jgi:N-acetylglucosamine-6-sulfatase